MGLAVIELLARHVTHGVSVPDRFLVAQQNLIASDRSSLGFGERHGHEYAEVPQVDQLAAQKEDAVENENRVVGRGLGRRGRGLVRAKVEDAAAVAAVATGPQRVQQRGPQRRVVERVEVVALGRLGPTRVALRTGAMEAV